MSDRLELRWSCGHVYVGRLTRVNAKRPVPPRCPYCGTGTLVKEAAR